MKPEELDKLKTGAKVLIPQDKVGVKNAQGKKVVATLLTTLEGGKKGKFKPAESYWTAGTASEDAPKNPLPAYGDDYSQYMDAVVKAQELPPGEPTLTKIANRDPLVLPCEDIEPYTWEHSNKTVYALKTDYDREACEDPMALLAKAKYDWVQVKEYYQTFKKNEADPPAKSLSHPDGGMQVLLDYRSWKVDQLVDSLRPLALEMARKQRSDAVDRLKKGTPPREITPQQHKAFLAAAQPPGGDAPGSTEPTSDIDLNTFNQGTGFLVRMFNDLFTRLHERNEAGIVFDVNIYGKDFLPNLGTIKGSRETPTSGPPLFVLPVRDHEFTTRETEYADALAQLAHGLLKVRRYMATREMIDAHDEKEWLSPEEWKNGSHADLLCWDNFVGLLRRALPEKENEEPEKSAVAAEIRSILGYVDPEFQRKQKLLATMVTWIQGARGSNRSSRQQVVASVKQLKDNSNGKVALPRLDRNKVEDRNDLMAAETRIYEVRLRQVAELRATFDLEKFLETKESAGRVDAAYRKLREAGSDALYFANEAYVTSGAVTQVVGGKQKVSGGVKSDREDGAAKANIAYQAHELVHSMLDQLSDVYKETKRHYLHHPESKDDTDDQKKERLGEAVLGASKYFHRMFNAIKHLYLIIGIVDGKKEAGSAKPNLKDDELRDYIWTQAFSRYPKGDFPDLTRFIVLQRLGFGLEALKKLQLDWTGTNPGANLKHLFETKFSLRKPEDAGSAVYGRRPAIDVNFLNPAESAFEIAKAQKLSKERIAADAIDAYFEGCLTYTEMDYRKIEDVRKAVTRLAVKALTDYAAFAAQSDEVIGSAMVAAQRPYPRLNQRDYYGNVAP